MIEQGIFVVNLYSFLNYPVLGKAFSGKNIFDGKAGSMDRILKRKYYY
jgi:hypothetical protein